MKLTVGTPVVHPSHGPATISEMTQREVGGELRDYVVLHRPSEKMRVMVPIEQVEEIGLRPAVEDTEGVLEILGGQETESGLTWRKLRARNEAALRSGGAKELAVMVRDLAHKEERRGISVYERKLYRQARVRLLQELDVAMDGVDDIEGLVDETLPVDEPLAF